jgi:hypothetical protein
MNLPCKNPFAPKKAPPRKKQTVSALEMSAVQRAKEFGLDYNKLINFKLDEKIKLNFDTQSTCWLNGFLNFLKFKR